MGYPSFQKRAKFQQVAKIFYTVEESATNTAYL